MATLRTIGSWALRASPTACSLTSSATSCPLSYRTQIRSSHIGSMPIQFTPSVVSLRLSSDPPPRPNPSRPLPPAMREATSLIVEGPKGTQTVPIQPFVRIEFEGQGNGSETGTGTGTGTDGAPSKLTLSVVDPSERIQRSVWGLTRALIANAVEGVQNKHSKVLRLVGVGYRAGVEEDLSAVVPGSAEAAALAEGANGAKRKRERLNLKLGYAHPVLIPIPADISVTTPQPTRIILKGVDKQRLGEFAARIRAWRPPEPYKGKGIFIDDETIKLRATRKK